MARNERALPSLLLMLGLAVAGTASAGLRFTPVPGPSGADVSSLVGDGSTLWAGTLRGVWRLSAGGWQLDGLGDQSVTSVAVADGSVWAATGERLLRRSADGAWTAETLPSAAPFPSVLVADGSTLYVGGLGVYRRPSGGTWTALPGPGSGLVVSALVDSGTLIVGLSAGGAARLVPGQTMFSPMLAGMGLGEGATALATLSGTLYAGTSRGVYAWNGAAWVPDPNFGIHDVRALSGAGGSLRAATFDAGVRRKSGASWSADSAGLLPVATRAFATLGSDLVLGTSGGPVYQLRGGSWSELGAGTLAATVVSDVFTRNGGANGAGQVWTATRGAGVFVRGAETTPPPVGDGCGDVRAVVPTVNGGAMAASGGCGPLLFAQASSSWSAQTQGLANGTVITTLASSTASGTFGGTDTTGMQRFTGSIWGADNNGISASGAVSAVREVGGTLYASLREGLVSRGAVSWNDASNGLPSGLLVSALGGTADAAFAGLVAGGVYRRPSGADGMFRREGFGAFSSPLNSLDVVNGRVVLGAGPSGVLVKRDGGFAPEPAGLPAGVDVRVVREGRWDAAADPSQRRVLYAGTAGHGLFGASAGPLVKTVPVVLDVVGATGSRFRTELVLGNRRDEPVTMRLELNLAPGFGLRPSDAGFASGSAADGVAGGAAVVTVPARGEVRAADALELLRSQGLPVPVAGPGSPVAGSLSIHGDTASQVEAATQDVYAIARTYTGDAATGTYGLFYDGTADVDAAEDEASVYGLRSLPGVSRSNLALVHVPGRGVDPIELSVQVYSATGVATGAPITRTLQPGEWNQLNAILTLAGLPEGSYGYARIVRTKGTGAWVAYGIVNDARTSDGSFLPMFRPGGLAAARRIIVPVILDVVGVGGARFTTELTLVNDSPLATPVDLFYQPAPGFGSAQGAPVVTVSVPARAQLTIPDAIQYLREHGLTIPQPAQGGSQAGTLSVDFRFLQALDSPRTVALARTSTPNPNAEVGGTFGLFYTGVARGGGARRSAVVPALTQDGTVRSNLAVVHLGGGSDLAITLSVQLYDATTGLAAGAPLRVTLQPGDWYQFSQVLSLAGASPQTTKAVAVVTRIEGDDTFLAYGVVNDNVTSDGSFLAMIPGGDV